MRSVSIYSVTLLNNFSKHLTVFCLLLEDSTFIYSATTWTGPLRTKLTNQNINWEQRMAPFFVNGPMKLENRNNGLTTKFWNPTKLRRVADLSGNFVTFWLVRFDPVFFFETVWMWPPQKIEEFFPIESEWNITFICFHLQLTVCRTA